MLIGVYGTLKSGGQLHEAYGLNECRRLADSTIRGAMDLCSWWPRLWPEGAYPPSMENEHVLEVYEVSDAQFDAMDGMEQEAGYIVETKTIDNQTVHVWLMPRNTDINEHKLITKFPL